MSLSIWPLKVTSAVTIVWGYKSYCCHIWWSSFISFPLCTVWSAFLQNGWASSLFIFLSGDLVLAKRVTLDWWGSACIKKRWWLQTSQEASAHGCGSSQQPERRHSCLAVQARANCFPDLCMQICRLYACNCAPLGILVMALSARTGNLKSSSAGCVCLS